MSISSEKLRKVLHPIQIDTMHFRFKPRRNPGSQSQHRSVNRTAVGYPRGFYDEYSKFPIVKSGIIASRWGFPFGGKPHFLVDAKLFPGSSGSMVISKPTNIGSKGGQVYHTVSGKKEFLFLGIFSGEYYQQRKPIETEDFILISKVGFNLGVVWYYRLITEIISDGKSHD